MAKKNEKRYGTCQNPECMNYGMSEVIPDDGNCPICHKPMKSEEDSNDGGDVDLDNIEDIPFEERKKTKGIDSKLIAIIVAAVLVLAGAGFGIWKAFGESDPMDEIAKIKLDKKNITLVVGQKDVIKATVVDKDGKEIKDAKVTYVWTAKNEKVASITQGGEVTALKRGKTSITVKIEGDDKHRATCKVEVKEGTVPPPPPTYIEQLSITDAKNFTLKKGGTKQLQYQAVPEKNDETPVWESSDPSVATVEANGVVKAIKKGTAQIYIKALKVASAPVTVTVEDRVEPVPLSYGKYTGERDAQGQPHGFGDVVFTKSKQINGSTYAEPGYKIRNARYIHGKLQSGTLYDSDGNKVCFIDANNNL